MKTFAVILGAMLLSVSAMAGGDATTTPSNTPTSSKGTCMKFDKEVYDYGTINQYEDGTCVLCFTNTCDKDIVVGCATSCTCAIAYCSQEPVKPGDYGEIRVRYDTRKPGAFKQNVIVTTYPDQNSVTITIKGLVLKRGT